MRACQGVVFGKWTRACVPQRTVGCEHRPQPATARPPPLKAFGPVSQSPQFTAPENMVCEVPPTSCKSSCSAHWACFHVFEQGGKEEEEDAPQGTGGAAVRISRDGLVVALGEVSLALLMWKPLSDPLTAACALCGCCPVPSRCHCVQSRSTVFCVHWVGCCCVQACSAGLRGRCGGCYVA